MKRFGKKSTKLGDKDYYIYCGRPSKLGNPYFMQNESQRVNVIEQCRSNAQWNEVLEDFVLWAKKTDIDELKLGCFCAPRACHCDIIKERMDREFN